MSLRVFVIMAVLIGAVAFAQEILWVSDFEDVEPGNPDPTWSNSDFIVQSIDEVKAYTAPWGYSGYSIYQTPVPAEHWLELRVRIDDVASPESRLSVVYRQGNFQVAEFGYNPSDSLFWVTMPEAYCGIYYEADVMEEGVWYRWLICSEPSDVPGQYQLKCKWWCEEDNEPGWLITRQQYLCFDPIPMADENDVSIVCINASEFYIDWVEVRVPIGNLVRPVPLSSLTALSASRPNPANPIATISYSIASEERVSLRVFNLLGQEIAVLVDEVKRAGTYQVLFDGSNLPSGIYIYRLETLGFSSSRKMVLLK